MTTPLLVRTVVRWVGPNKKIHYHFGATEPTDSKDKIARYIPYTLYQDDTRIDTLKKLYDYLTEYYKTHPEHAATEWTGAAAAAVPTPVQRKDLPIVAWNFSKGFLLTPAPSEWNGWTANPWKLGGGAGAAATALKETLARLPQSPSHESHATELTQTAQFAFSLMSDLPLFAQVPQLRRWYSLYADTKALLPTPAALAQHRILSELLQDASATPIETEWVSQIKEFGSFTFLSAPNGLTHGAHASPKILYDQIPLSPSLPFIQWKEGMFIPPLYRLYKHHRLTPTQLEAYTDLSKIPANDQRIQMVYLGIYKQTVVPFRLLMTFATPGAATGTGTYTIQVKLSERGPDNDWIEAATAELKSQLRRFSNDYRLTFHPTTSHISARFLFPMPFPIQPHHWAPFGWLFRPSGSSLTYLRSANTHQRLDPEAFIQSQMTFIEDEQTLLETLQLTFHLTVAQAQSWINEYKEGRSLALSLPIGTGKRRSWMEIPAIVHTSYQANTKSLLVQCDNFLSMADIHRMSLWMRGALTQIKRTGAPGPGPSKKKPVAKSPSPSPVFFMDDSPEVLLSSASASASASTSASTSASAASSQLGGTYDLVEKLKQADPEIFIHTRLPNNPSRYPRLCSANTNQQPVVLTQEEMKTIDRSEYKDSYDNKILYGSDKDPKNHHYYFCPRIWCPTSKVPLTAQQYEDLGRRCPGPNHEEPWLFYDADYWSRNPSTPHYIGFHKKQGTNQLCLPCCKRLPEKPGVSQHCYNHIQGPGPGPSRPPQPPDQKSAPPQPPKPPDTTDEYYLLHSPAPLPSQRWGPLPELLHQQLQPEVPYSQCAVQLKSDPACLVRKGIAHHRDSLLNALGYALCDGGGKRAFLEYLEKHLTPTEFLMLQNGDVLSQFLDPEPIPPTQYIPKLLKWREWVQQFPSYIQRFQLTPLLAQTARVAEFSLTDQLRLSRELSIYTAWTRYWDYLKSSEVKTLADLSDLVSLLFQVRLVVWEKRSETEVYLNCSPQLSKTTHDLRPYTLLYFENNYYEPIEFRARGGIAKTLLAPTGAAARIVERLDALTRAAGAHSPESWRPYILLETLPRMLGEPATALAPAAVVLGPRLSPCGLLLNGGFFLSFPPIPGRDLKNLQALLKVPRVLYLEDQFGDETKQTATLPTHVLTPYMRLLKFLKLKWNASVAEAEAQAAADSDLYTTLTLKPLAQMRWDTVEMATPTIPTTTLTPTEETRLLMNHQQAYWTRLQRDVGRKLLTHYSSVHTAYSQRGLKGVLQMPLFARLSKGDLTQLLEEIPLAQHKKLLSKDSLYRWWSHIGTRDAYPIYTSHPRDDRTEWRFSQSAVAQGLPRDLLYPPRASRPRQEAPMVLVSAASAAPAPVPVPVPSPPEAAWRPLPNKWLQKKHYGWEAYRRAVVSLQETLVALAHQFNVPLSWEDFKIYHSIKVAEMINADDDTLWSQYLQDPAVWRQLARRMKMEKSKSQTVLKHFLQLSKAEQWAHWEKIAPTLPPVDLDAWIFAHLTRCVVLMLHRSPSGRGVDTGERHRFQDFLSSASLYYPDAAGAGAAHLPLVVFYKEAKIDALQSTYEWVEYQPEHKKYFIELKHAPDNLQKLIRALMETP